MNNATKTQPEMHVPAIIPRFRSMVNAIYPGTGFAITEWGYFNDNNVACSLAEADIYGIFGREKVDLVNQVLFAAAGLVLQPRTGDV